MKALSAFSPRSRMKVLPAGIIKRLHVDRRIVAQNRRRGPRQQMPAITIQTSRGPYKTNEAWFKGSARFVQSATPLSCGARLWVETRSEVAYR